MKLSKFLANLLAFAFVAFSVTASGATLTDDIRALNAANKTAVDAKLAAIDALPSGGGSGALTWPAGTNLLGGTSPALMSYPPGWPGDSGGYPEPSKGRRMAASNFPGIVYLFGDSTLQPMPCSFISPFCENFAVGGRDLRRGVNELHDFPGLAQGSAAVFRNGVNEFAQTWYYGSRAAAVPTILYIYSAKMAPWMTGKWYILHLLPVVNSHPEAADYNAAVAAVNAGMASAFSSSAASVTIIPVNPAMLESDGSLKASMAMSDKQHLSPLGTYTDSLPVNAALKADGINPP